MQMTLFLMILSAAALAAAEDGHGSGGDRYYDYSENSEWYDSYGRLNKGYQDAPMKNYPRGEEPYYYYSDNSAWYDSYGRLRYGPRGIPANEYRKERR